MKRKFFPGFAGLLCMCLVPYLSAIAINGEETALVNRGLDVEMILPAVVASEISDKYEMETIKAQSILCRSDFYRRNTIRKKRELFAELEERIHSSYQIFFRVLSAYDSVYEKAVAETKGEVLALKKELKLLPYHEISAGCTRDGREIFKKKEYSYLKPVESKADRRAEEFVNCVYVKASRFPKGLKISRRDQAGYVVELAVNGQKVEGECFARGIGLPSSCFRIEKAGKNLKFICKGKGHGLGFSQYGGNEFVKKGKSYQEILKIYFPEMEIENIVHM